MKTRRQFITLILVFILGISGIYSQEKTELNIKTLNSDMSYYQRLSRKKKFNSNDRMAILYRILNKYTDAGIDTSVIEKEIKNVRAGKYSEQPVQKTTSNKSKQVNKTGKLKANTSKKETKKPQNKNETVKTAKAPGYSREILLPNGKTFDDDMYYYFELSGENKELDPFEKLYLLYKIREKYSNAPDIDTTILMDEIFKLEDILTKRVGANIEGKTLDDDMLYYFKYCEEKNLNVNDRLFILYKIKERYIGQEVDTKILDEELKQVEFNWMKQKSPEAYITGITTGSILNILKSTSGIEEEKIPGTINLIKQPDYIIQTGDVIGIKVYPNRELSTEVIVRPDGTLYLPLLGMVVAQGESVDSFGKFLEKSYSRYLVNPKISVNIRHSSENEILITGEIHNPGVYSFKEKLKLLELIGVAGGFTTSANVKEIKVHRGKRGSRRIILVDAEEIIKSGDLSRDIILERGDIIEIPRSIKKISVIGAVNTPGIYDFQDGLKALDAISLAGGPSKGAKLRDAKIFRQDGDKKTTLDLNLEEIMGGKTESDRKLEPSDIILVPYKKFWE